MPIFGRRNKSGSKSQSDLGKSLEALEEARKDQAAASMESVAFADRMRLAAAVYSGQKAVIAARAAEEQRIRDENKPARDENRNKARAERARTKMYARRAVALINAADKRNNVDPDYTVRAERAVVYPRGDIPKDPKLKPKPEPKGVRGWMLFDKAESEATRVYPNGKTDTSYFEFYYHGVFVRDDGELMAFFNLKLPLPPGNRPGLEPINLVGTPPRQPGDRAEPQTPELMLIPYDDYRELAQYQDPRDIYRGSTERTNPIADEYDTQQQLAALLVRHGVAP